MAWVLWDDEEKRVKTTVKELPPEVAELDRVDRERLGYRPLVVRRPEDFIPRFPSLLGSSQFTLLLDGTVEQVWPNADFSANAVRGWLRDSIYYDAKQLLNASDWMIVRKMETGKDVPAEVTALREKLRTHAGELMDTVMTLEPRELVDFTWTWPTTTDQTFVEGVPIIHITNPPAAIPDHLKKPPKPVAAPAIPPGVDGPVPVRQDDGSVILYNPDGSVRVDDVNHPVGARRGGKK